MTVYDNLTFPKLADRPYVIINMVTTVDGKAVPTSDDQKLFGGRHDKAAMHELRAHADALLYGSTTGKDVWPKQFLDAEFQARRKAVGTEPLITYVLLSHRGEFSESENIFSSPQLTPLVYVPDAAKPKIPNAEVRHAGKDSLDLAKILAELKTKDGIDVLLCEGGPSTNQPFFAAGLLDELFVTVTPKVFGGKAPLTIVEGEPLDPKSGMLNLISAQPDGDEVFLHYKVMR